MEHRIKRDSALLNLVSEFEKDHGCGSVKFLDVKAFGQVIEYYEMEGAINKAINVAKVALAQYKYRSEFYITLAKLYLSIDQANASIKYLNKAETIAPYENEITLLQAKSLVASSKYDEAFEKLDDARLFASVEDSIEISLIEANIYQNTKEYPSMYDCLIEALKVMPEHKASLDMFWTATELNKYYDISIDFLNELIDKNPYNYLAWFNLGHSLSYNGEYTDAIDAMEYAFIINPSFENGYLDCADLCVQINDYERAAGILFEALEKFGPDSDLLTKIAECQIRLGQNTQAKYNLYKAIRLEQHCDEIYALLAECYSASEEWYKAINAYHRAIAIEDGCEDYYLGLAKAYIAVEEYNKATVNFQLAVNIGPEQSKYWQEYVSFMIKMGLYEEALAILDESEEYTFGADLLYLRALIHLFNDEKKEGVRILQEALEEDFNMHRLMFTLAPELELNNQINSMINYFRKEN